MVKKRITSVALIAKDSKGREINLTVIKTGNDTAIVRKPKEFLQDLKNSFLIGDNVMNIKHPEVRQAMKGLRGGIVEGNIEYSKKGDAWTVTEDSLCITDPNHPDYGTAAVGDKRELERDQARIVDGFLELEQNMKFQAMMMNANAIAAATAGLDDIYSEPVSVESAESAPAVDEDGNLIEEGKL